jgi:hypothetical protein
VQTAVSDYGAGFYYQIVVRFKYTKLRHLSIKLNYNYILKTAV